MSFNRPYGGIYVSQPEQIDDGYVEILTPGYNNEWWEKMFGPNGAVKAGIAFCTLCVSRTGTALYTPARTR